MARDVYFAYAAFAEITDDGIEVVGVDPQRAIDELPRIFLLAVKVEAIRGITLRRKPARRVLMQTIINAARQAMHDDDERPLERTAKSAVDSMFAVDFDLEILVYKKADDRLHVTSMRHWREGFLLDAPRYVKTALVELLLRGATETIRTSDLLLRREALYPAELRPHLSSFLQS